MRSGFLFALFCLATCQSAAGLPPGPGDRLASLTVGATTYRDVEIRSVNARTVIITHSGGMVSIRLRDLSPEWQARFGYDPKADTPRPPAATPAPPRSAGDDAARRRATARPGRLDALLREFGTPATLAREVDLRPKFFQLELGVKNQGRRPSCAIFALVSALEFQHAELTGRPEKFSEEYLIWATRKTIQRLAGEDALTGDDADAGFSLLEVLVALRGYGIPLQTSMPNTFGRGMETIGDPPAAVVEEARQHQAVFIHAIPGRDNATRINNLVHALNHGVPVSIGVAWPNFRALRNAYLSEQTPAPASGHAITLVGYQCPDGRLEETVFIFKNSWGVSWGEGGYGRVSFRYLHQHLGDTVMLEVRPRGQD